MLTLVSILSLKKHLNQTFGIFSSSILPFFMLIIFMHIYITDLYVETLDCTRVLGGRWHAVIPVLIQDTKSVL